MIAESEFQEVLAHRMKELADKTMRLCGVTTKPSLQNEEENEIEKVEQYVSLFTFDFSQDLDESEDTGGFISVIDLSSFKKKRSKKAPTEDQLVFNF